LGKIVHKLKYASWPKDDEYTEESDMEEDEEPHKTLRWIIIERTHYVAKELTLPTKLSLWYLEGMLVMYLFPA
jgi:hypothetical protein